MKIILVRHGESAMNVGIPGEENNLTAKGVNQAIAVGDELKSQKIDAIYCSSTPRCIQTLDEILRVRDDNMPIHLTSLVGPKLKKEKYEELKARVELFLDDLKYDHEPDATILIVSHLLSIQMMTLLLTKSKRRLENGEMIEVST
jgi:broad specificity phosphatase PhoE